MGDNNMGHAPNVGRWDIQLEGPNRPKPRTATSNQQPATGGQTMDTAPNVSARPERPDQALTMLHITSAPGPEHGWLAASEMAGEFWRPQIGPTCVVVGQYLSQRAAEANNGTDWYEGTEVRDLAKRFGIGTSAMIRAFKRLAVFGMATWNQHSNTAGSLTIPERWPVLPAKYQLYLPADMRADLDRKLAADAQVQP